MTRRAWTLSLLAVVIALATLMTSPMVMMSFRPQGPTELKIALAVLRFAPLLLAVALGLAGWAVVRAWPRGWLRRVGTGFALVIVIGATGLARINMFEEMFASMQGLRFAAADATGLEGETIVMTVAMGDARRAYPVHVMAYHHVLNDVVGDTPLVVTY